MGENKSKTPEPMILDTKLNLIISLTVLIVVLLLGIILALSAAVCMIPQTHNDGKGNYARANGVND